MTLHNISGSEVGRARPVAYLSQISAPRPRRRLTPFVLAPFGGVLLFAIDSWIGFPLCVAGVLLGGAVLLFWPAPR